MTTEQKALAYDKALERAKRMFSNKEIEYLFPELIESEDERIRKALIKFVKGYYEGLGADAMNQDVADMNAYISWLEKQGEQKLTEEVNSFIESLGKKQPQGLDEAAVEYEHEFEKKTPWIEFDETHAHWFRHMFKAGAKWDAEQGVTVDGTFPRSCGYPSVIELKTYLRDYEGKDVIIQIRKKDTDL